MRLISLSARAAFDAASSDDVSVVLLHVTHPDWDVPVRVSSDPTERLSSDPLLYGTRSTWLGANPASEPFLFMTMSAELPGDQEDVPTAARLILSNFDSAMVAALRSFTRPPNAHLAVVLASSPDVIEVEARDLLLVAADFDASQIELSLTRRAIEDEAFPTARMTKQRFPGLFQ